MKIAAFHLAGLLALAPLFASADQASPPQATSLTIYDQGLALVNENRRVNLAKGDNELVIRQLPAGLDSSSAAVTMLAGGAGLELQELRFENDVANENKLLARYLGRDVKVTSGGGRESAGKLLSIPRNDSGTSKGTLTVSSGAVDAQAFINMQDVSSIQFPGALQNAFLEPTLLWGANAAQDGLQNIRLTYLTEGLSWWATHEITLAPGGNSAQLSSRVGIRNESGGRFSDARVRLVATAQGPRAAATAQQYLYGQQEPMAGRGEVLDVVGTYELAHPVTIQDGQARFFSLVDLGDLAVSRFYVYDGVRFDRFQRNKQADWNYGSEFDPAVETHLVFKLPPGAASGLPGGTLRLMQLKADGSLDYLGQDYLAAAAPGADCSVRVGPARGLSGERERTGYTEVRPLHEYEETFEIRLSNLSDEEVQIRVVEHLYRSADYDIVKSDAEYISTAPQTIEFRPDLKPGGKRTLRYTVRYRW